MEKIINRDIYLSRLIDKKENGLIKVITGIRRCGKSYLLFYLFRDYLISSGVKEEQINFRQQEETHIMENIIYNELIIRGYSVDVGVVEIIENVEGKKEENSVRLILL